MTVCIFMLLFQGSLFSKDKDQTNKIESYEKPVAPPEIPKLVPNVVQPLEIPKPVPPITSEDARRVQKQINEIIKVHEQLKSQYQEQAAEIQRITEQAKIHQRILRDLEEERMKRTDVPDTKEILRQEKIRVIIQETQKNQTYINGLTQKDKIQKTQ